MMYFLARFGAVIVASRLSAYLLYVIKNDLY